jgi:hypothetical protein
LPVDEALEMFKKAGFAQGIDGKPGHGFLKIEEFLSVVEKYFAPETRLDHKIHSKELFEGFLSKYPELVPARKLHLPEGATEEEVENFMQKKRFQEDDEVRHARAKFRKHILCEHLILLRGVELTYFEFKEILMELALVKLPRDLVDPKKTGKTKGMITRFLEEHFLKRLGALIRRARNAPVNEVPVTMRTWPETEKDRLIRLKLEERRRKEEEERLAKEERER